MNFDSITKRLASRRHARRHATKSVAASQAASAGTPSGSGPEMLFVQSFESGNVTTSPGADGRYTVTLEHGLGQTIYFSDRPDRIVGTTPTEQFLDALGFTPDNPPNAAILTDNGNGDSTLAVVELFNPVYDAENTTVTYEMEMLEHWKDSTDLGLAGTPVDLDHAEATFRTAHLFIDGCPIDKIRCVRWDGNMNYTRMGTFQTDSFGGYCYSATENRCLPCTPWHDTLSAAYDYWEGQCNEVWEGCEGECEVVGITHAES